METTAITKPLSDKVTHRPNSSPDAPPIISTPSWPRLDVFDEIEPIF